MDIEEMLNMMTAQRHEFVNHLQVISGMIQLDQGQRAREYIIKISKSIKHFSKLSQLKLPYLAAVLLNTHYLANNNQVTVKYDVQTDLAGCKMPDQTLAELLEKLINQILAEVAPTSTQQYCLHIRLTQPDTGGYLCILGCTGMFQEDNIDNLQIIHGAQKTILLHGGQLTWQRSPKEIEITLFWPS